METTETSPLANTSSEEYKRLKEFVLKPPEIKQPPKGILTRLGSFLKSLNIKGAPEINHVSPLKDISPKEDDYPPKK